MPVVNKKARGIPPGVLPLITALTPLAVSAAEHFLFSKKSGGKLKNLKRIGGFVAPMPYVGGKCGGRCK